MIRIDAMWLAVEPADMRAGADRLLARVVQVFGSARAHHGYRCINARSTWRPNPSITSIGVESFFLRIVSWVGRYASMAGLAICSIVMRMGTDWEGFAPATYVVLFNPQPV